MINFSTNNRFGQEISYSTASTPDGPWIPAVDVPAFHEDGTLYKSGRWDTIMTATHDGVMYGWWTATPADGSIGFGHGTTVDGVHWTLLPPAKAQFGKETLQASQLEVGGVARLPNGKWYAHACAIYWGHVSGLGGCFNMVSDSPGGPFVLTHKNWALLGYDAHDGIPAYFSRPFVGPGGVSLVNHIHMGHMSTLKLAIVDELDVMRWAWWAGNDALRGSMLPQRAERGCAISSRAPCILLVDSAHGSLVEGEIVWGSDPSTAIVFSQANATGGGFQEAKVVEEAGEAMEQEPGPATVGGFARLTSGSNASVWSTLDLGRLGGKGAVDSWTNSSHQGLSAAASEPTRGLHLAAGDNVRWRLLLRHGLYELYFAPSRDNTHQTYYFAAAYDAPTAVCAGGQTRSHVNVELHGAFARSRALVAYQTTLDLHDYSPTC